MFYIESLQEISDRKYNGNYFEETSNGWLEQASLHNESIICLALDIDNFKGINDEFGRLVVDEVIKHVSKACSNILSENELIGRYGGDEFVFILALLYFSVVFKKDAALRYEIGRFPGGAA